MSLLDIASITVRFGSWLRNLAYEQGWRQTRRPPFLAISVGNISFGGTGKTPLSIFLLSLLREKGWRPCLISRGYRGSWEKKGGIVSDGEKILATWQEAGDEPYMVARAMPGIAVVVGQNRYLSSLRAQELGCNVAVLDDAFQHRQLNRDLDIVLINHRYKARRESWRALRRADIILIRGKESLVPAAAKAVIDAGPSSPLIFTYELVPSALYLASTGEALSPEILKEKLVIAFCGLASPENFRLTLEELGAAIQAFYSFPDHYPYPRRSLEKIVRETQRYRPDLVVTTEKDAVKLMAERSFLETVPLAILGIKFKADPGFRAALEKFLQQAEGEVKRRISFPEAT